LITIFRGLFYSFAQYLFNVFNGFSGINPIDNLIYATYNVNLTTLAVGFLTPMTQDLNFPKYSETGEKLPFELSRFYLSCRIKARTYLREFVIIYLVSTFFSVC
jgi:hypothetical protein